MTALERFNQKCRQSYSSPLLVALRYLRYRMAGRSILAHDRTIIRGLKNIETGGLLQIGMSYVGFTHERDTTHLNITGRLRFRGNYSIGKGCRFDIGPNVLATFGPGYVNPNTSFIIMHGLTVGDGCAISWGCEFLDEDFHRLTYPGQKEKQPPIELGNRVWVGSHVTVLKGSRIPDGCVVASGSVVTSVFEKENCLIGGHPAKVIREEVEWQ